MIPDPSSVFQSQDMKPFKKISSLSSCIPGWRVYIPPVPRDLCFASGKQSGLGGSCFLGSWTLQPEPGPRGQSAKAKALKSQGWTWLGTLMAKGIP